MPSEGDSGELAVILPEIQQTAQLILNMTVSTHLSYCTKSTSFSKNNSTHYTRQGIVCDIWICFWRRRHRQRYVSNPISNILLSVHFHALEFCRLTRRFEAYGNVIRVSFNSMPAILRAERSLPFDGIPVYQYLLKNSGNGDMLPSNRPWDAVQYYYEQLCQLSKEFLCKLGMSMFEHLLELEERHEFQQHGSIYSHCIMD